MVVKRTKRKRKMRTIKFRVWDKTTKAFMEDGVLINQHGQTRIWFFEKNNQSFPMIKETDEFEIQQFTGFLDKKENKIYEGDILRASGYSVEVFWDRWNGQWKVVMPGKERYYLGAPLIDAIERNAKIIGNILENPELLEK